MRGPALCLLAGLMVAFAPPAGRAADPPAPLWKAGTEPLQISSKTMEVLKTENMVVFSGDVVARQGEMTLHAQRVEVRAEEKTQEIKTVHATGNVRILKDDIVATGEVADYEAATGVAVLTVNPKVWRGKDVVAGKKITLYLAEDRSVVEGAEAVLFPRQRAQEGKAR